MSKVFDLKTEELIALGVAYGINCTFCMEFHKKKAVEAGLTLEEINSAILISESVKMGAFNKTKASAKKLFGAITEERCCPEGSACCP